MQWGIGRKKKYPALFCCYLQTGPAQFGQNHPPSSFSPQQAITATKQSWVKKIFCQCPIGLRNLYHLLTNCIYAIVKNIKINCDK